MELPEKRSKTITWKNNFAFNEGKFDRNLFQLANNAITYKFEVSFALKTPLRPYYYEEGVQWYLGEQD